jgi:DNA modification methylase
MFLLSKSEKYYFDYKAILEPVMFDGRKDTKFKGSVKYKDSGQTFAERGHERWPNKIVGRTERKMEGALYGGDGSGLHGHSGYYDKDGNPRFNQFEDGQPARNKRSVWTVTTKPFKGAHFATFPPDLITPCILAGSKPGDVVLDTFMGAGTTGLVAAINGRRYLGIDLNPKYIKMAEDRIETEMNKIFTASLQTRLL